MSTKQTPGVVSLISSADHSGRQAEFLPEIHEFARQRSGNLVVSQSVASRQAIPATLTCLSDGSSVEWAKHHADSTRIRLLVWNNGRTTIQDEIEHNGLVFLAPMLDPRLSSAICLPAGVLPSGNIRERLGEIAAIMRRHIRLAEEHFFLAAAFCVSTWFADLMEVFPYLVISGPTGSGKSTLLKLLRCFCRRAILLGDITSAAVYRMADEVMPTLLLDECQFDGGPRSRELRRFLRVGNANGEYVARGSKLFAISCPKVICVNEPIEDVALNTRAIHIPMLPYSNQGLAPVCRTTLDTIAAEQQPRLVGLRFENLNRARPLSSMSAQTIETFSPKLREIARALVIPLAGDDLLESQLMGVLEGQDAEAVLERRNDPAWHVVKALFASCHPPRVDEVTVGSFTEHVNLLRTVAEEENSLKPRKVGAILKGLGVRTISLGRWGRGFVHTPQLRRKAHELARQFGVSRRDINDWMTVKSGYAGPACELCAEFDLDAGLRPSPPLPRPRRVRHPLFPESERDQIEKRVPERR